MLGNKNSVGNKGGNITAHNRHHVKKNLFNEFCDLCIEHCKENNITLMITRSNLRNDYRNGLSKNSIAKKYGVSYDLIHKWLKQMEEEYYL